MVMLISSASGGFLGTSFRCNCGACCLSDHSLTPLQLALIMLVSAMAGIVV